MRDAALEYADRDTIKVWELLKVLDSAINAERDPEWKRSLRDAREKGLEMFTTNVPEPVIRDHAHHQEVLADTAWCKGHSQSY
jgi:hypothetical protein